jgi:hypothetical protein
MMTGIWKGTIANLSSGKSYDTLPWLYYPKSLPHARAHSPAHIRLLAAAPALPAPAPPTEVTEPCAHPSSLALSHVLCKAMLSCCCCCCLALLLLLLHCLSQVMRLLLPVLASA